MRLTIILLSTALVTAGCAEPAVESIVDAGQDSPPETRSTANGDANSNLEQSEDATEPAVSDDTPAPTAYNSLNDLEQYVLLSKGTERAFVGEYTDTEDPGTYICRQCNARLYKSTHKFHSNCGWPAFDDEIPGAVTHRPETDGTGRTEIVCTNCQGHLGHVFMNEGYTAKQTRHCVNSVSMTFIPEGDDIPDVIVLDK